MEKFQSKKLDHEKVLRDPVHNYIHVKDKVILDIINSKELQDNILHMKVKSKSGEYNFKFRRA